MTAPARPGKAQWLLFKAKDARANPAFDVIAERPESVVSGRAATRGPQRVGALEQGKSARALLQFVGEPALATADVKITAATTGSSRIKYDGYRLLGCKAGSEARVYTRRGHDWTDRFRFVAETPSRGCDRPRVRRSTARRASSTSRVGPSFGRPARLAGLGRRGQTEAGGPRLRGLRSPLARRTRPPPRAHRGAARAARGPGARAEASPHALSGRRREARVPPRGREGGRARGAHREASGVGVRRRSLGPLGEDALRQAPGVRHRRLHPDGRHARRRGRAPARGRRPARPGELVFAGRVGTGFDARTRQRSPRA